MQGLFGGCSLPVFPKGMAINSHNITASINVRLKTPPLVIIEFILEELPSIGSSGQMLFMSLGQNYVGDKKDLHFEQIQFDLKNPRAINDHMDLVSKRVKDLQRM